MATLLEMATEIVAAHASTTSMTKDELISEITSVYQSLSALERGESAAPVVEEQVPAGPAISKRKAFGKDKVYCMICGVGMTTLTKHLMTAHQLKPGEYRKQFGIPRTQTLAAKNYVESRRQMALDRGLADKLADARARKLEKAKPTTKKKPAAPKAEPIVVE
jgi:predicted transcriptional regulator